jgi:hypothetical protein
MELDCARDVLKLGGAMVTGLVGAVVWLAHASVKCQAAKDQYIERQHKLMDSLLTKLRS